LEEYKIIQRLKQGDIASLEMLVQTYQEKGIRTAYLITQDKALARDVVQATFIRIYKKIQKFDPSRPFEPYFLRTVVNAAIRASKKSQRTISLEQFHEETGYLDEWLSSAENPESALEAQELTEKIEALLQQLSPEQRAVIVLKYYLGYSETEMAKHLDTPRGTIKSRLYQPRQQLKRLLQVNRNTPLIKEELA
jgi:RNA polymerase sigma-70 factor (ECF subfamily)